MGTAAIRIFVVHAEEDYRFYDTLVGQARTARLAAEFSHMPTKQPWVPHWKAACRTRVFQCDAAIVLISKRTGETTGIQTELDYVMEAGVPTLGVRQEQGAGTVPEQLRGVPLIDWNWAAVAAFVRSLQDGTAAGGAG